MSREVKPIKVVNSWIWTPDQWKAYQHGFKAAQAGIGINDAPLGADRQFWQAGFLQYEKQRITRKFKKEN